MQYPVPQFIDVEDKVIGPLTIKQFLWIVGGVACLAVEYFLLPFVGFVIAGIPTAGLFGAFGFYKIEGKPFYNFVLDFFTFSRRPRVRVWKREGDVKMAELFPVQRAEKQKPTAVTLTFEKANLAELVGVLDHELGSTIDRKPIVDPMAGRVEFSEESSNLLPPVKTRIMPHPRPEQAPNPQSSPVSNDTNDLIHFD